MSEYYEIIKNLREDSDRTLKDIADIIGTTYQYYQKYEKGIRPLPIKHLITLAKYYNVSTDYLLGLTDIKKPYPPKKGK